MVDRLQTFLVECRNSDLHDELLGKYRTDHSNENTKVFCVSNKFYQMKRHAKIQTALPYLRLSGIISLRQHCVSIVSTNQHREASAIINTEIPKLLSAIHLWVQSGLDTLDGERRAAVTRVLDDIEHQLRAVCSHREPELNLVASLLNEMADTYQRQWSAKPSF